MTLRVPMVSLERARELGEAMGMPARRTQSEAFRVVANNPGVARVAFSQLMQLLENNKFDTRLRELMIMRIGWVTGSAYEWTQHWRVATTAGIPPEDILAVRDWRNSGRLTPADKAILAATDECLAGKSISDAAWAEVAKHVTDPGQQVEFIIAMGNWMSFSMLFRNLRIPLAEGLMVWPPDGLASPAAERTRHRQSSTKETSMPDESNIPLLDHELAEDELAWMKAVYAGLRQNPRFVLGAGKRVQSEGSAARSPRPGRVQACSPSGPVGTRSLASRSEPPWPRGRRGIPAKSGAAQTREKQNRPVSHVCGRRGGCVFHRRGCTARPDAGDRR